MTVRLVSWRTVRPWVGWDLRRRRLLLLLLLAAAGAVVVHVWFRRAAARDIAAMSGSDLRIARMQQPGNVLVRQRLIEYYLMEERNEDALREALDAVKLAPRSAHLHYLLGKAYQRAGNGPAALRALERAVELDPRHARARFLLGHGNYWAEQPLIAARQFEEYVELQPADDIGFRFLGLARLRLGDLAGAEPALRRALELGPEASGNYQAMGDFYLVRSRDRHDLEQAAAMFRRALELQPGADSLRIQLAQALARLGRLREAAAEYERVYAHAPTNERVCFALIQTYRRLGDAARAARYRTLYERIVRVREAARGIREREPGTPVAPIQ